MFWAFKTSKVMKLAGIKFETAVEKNQMNLPLVPKQNRFQNPAQLLITLNSQLSELTNSNQHSKSVSLFTQIHSSRYKNISPNHYTITPALKSCACILNVALGSQIHSFAIRTNFVSFTHVSNSLLSFYAKTHSLKLAKTVFDSISLPDVYTYTTMLSAYCNHGCLNNAIALFEEIPDKKIPAWNALIMGYLKHGYRNSAIELFDRMHKFAIGFDRYTCASVLSLCDSVECASLGCLVHSLVIKTGLFECSVIVVNALLSMYFDCGFVDDGVSVFKEANLSDVVTYNSLISGLVKWEMCEAALIAFKELTKEKDHNLKPTELTYLSILSACLPKDIGEQIYGQVIRVGFENSLVVGNATVTMYSSCCDLVSARKIFDRIYERDIVSWNSMISAYSRENLFELAVELYNQMPSKGIEPDEYTYGSLVTCSCLLNHSKILQAVVMKNGLIKFAEVCNSFISVYLKNKEIDSAHLIFDEMDSRNIISWNSIISGSILNGFIMNGLRSFCTLINSGHMPNSYTLSIVLSTCGTISAAKLGEQVHCLALKHGSSSKTTIGNSLITMYTNVGELSSSSKVFYEISHKDIVSWNAIITAYSQNGCAHKAIEYFKLMQKLHVTPDHSTFTIILSSCSHAGFVEEGNLIFISMVKDYKMEPQMDHYSCLIDLLSRSGSLEEVQKLINNMSYKPNSNIWWIVLAACNTYKNLRLGKIAAKCLLEIEPENTEVYAMLSSINASVGRWEEASILREEMSKTGVTKKPGFSWVELKND